MKPHTHASTSGIVNNFLSAWAAALSASDFKALAELFDEYALFVATTPTPLLGRDQIQTYYEQVPVGLHVKATLMCATRPNESLVHALSQVSFEAPGGVSLKGRLGLSMILGSHGWRVSFYQLMVDSPDSD